MVAIVVVILVVMSRSGSTSAPVASGTAGTAAGSEASSAVSAAAAPSTELPADPAAQLQALAAQDSSTVEGMVGSWIPQLSSKRPGLVAEGKTWDESDILAEYRSLQATYPSARLLWTGDFANYRGRNFWATVVGQPMPTAAAANAWCDSQGLDADHCYAVRLTHTGGPDGNSVQRPHR
ncbi:hypothetical protein Acsp07_13040 [Actinomycetospora sp. NBRC 106378]|nr:hypothetical protein Acsp07_13040 [Actinomycetospora sp. NBRC 106378]